MGFYFQPIPHFLLHFITITLTESVYIQHPHHTHRRPCTQYYRRTFATPSPPDFIAIVRLKWPPTSLVTPASLWSTSVKPAHWFIKPASCTEAINKHVRRTRAWLTTPAHCWQQCLFQAIAFLLSRFVRWFIFWRGFLRRLMLGGGGVSTRWIFLSYINWTVGWIEVCCLHLA